MALLVAEKRGAETASTTGILKSSILSRTCRTPMAIWVPPGAPRMISGSPPSKTMVGQSELNRLFPGAMDPARPGLGSKTPMHPLYIKPNPGVMTPEGMPREWVMVTQFPWASFTATWVVSFDSGVYRSTFIRSPRLILAAMSAACGLLMSCSSGTSKNAGSPT